MSEIWIEIEDAKGYYVSNLGRFKSPNKFLTPTPDSNGYARVGIKGRTRRCHRIVAIHHISNPEKKLEVNHKIENITWIIYIIKKIVEVFLLVKNIIMQ